MPHLCEVEQGACGDQVDEVGEGLSHVDVPQGLEPALVAVYLPPFSAKGPHHPREAKHLLSNLWKQLALKTDSLLM